MSAWKEEGRSDDREVGVALPLCRDGVYIKLGSWYKIVLKTTSRNSETVDFKKQWIGKLCLYM